MLNQTEHAKKWLEVVGLEDCNETQIPIEPKLKFFKEKDRRLVGSLRYMAHTRPDISFAVEYISKFMQEPKEAHLKEVKHLIRYEKGTIHYGIKYKKTSGGNLVGYSDSNYIMDSEEGKNTSGNVIF